MDYSYTNVSILFFEGVVRQQPTKTAIKDRFANTFFHLSY